MTFRSGPIDLLRRHLRAGIGRLPGIQRAAPAHRRGFRPRAIEGVEAIHQQRPGRFRPGQHVERQQVDLGVPEHMPVIVVAGQRPRADRDALVGRVGRAVQVVDGEPQSPAARPRRHRPRRR